MAIIFFVFLLISIGLGFFLLFLVSKIYKKLDTVGAIPLHVALFSTVIMALPVIIYTLLVAYYSLWNTFYAYLNILNLNLLSKLFGDKQLAGYEETGIVSLVCFYIIIVCYLVSAIFVYRKDKKHYKEKIPITKNQGKAKEPVKEPVKKYGTTVIKMVISVCSNIFPSREKTLKKKILKDSMILVNEEIKIHKLSIAKSDKIALEEKLRNVISEHFLAHKADSILKNQAEFHELLKTMLREFSK